MDKGDSRWCFDEALDVLRGLGARLSEIHLPTVDQALAPTIMNSEAAVAHARLIESGDVRQLVSQSQAAGLERAAVQPMRVYVEAAAERSAVVLDLRRTMAEVDVIAAPTRIHEAPPIDTVINSWPRGHGRLAALAGLPTLSIPMGFGPRDLPLGLTLIGKRGRDHELLALAARFQRSTAWHLRTPIAWT
jgi:Asp-tRNA(Asn)/Glu-tRNA(Gln) amidotransferase A subunit family amidase